MTPLKKNRTCTGCRALEYIGYGGRKYECELDYLMNDEKPLEPCPKPKTYDQLINSPKV